MNNTPLPQPIRYRRLRELKKTRNKPVSVRAWYASAPRLLEFFTNRVADQNVFAALKFTQSADARSVLANMVGKHVIARAKTEKIRPLLLALLAGELRTGMICTFEGRFRSHGLSIRDDQGSRQFVNLRAPLDDYEPGLTLRVEFSKSGILTDTGVGRLMGQPHLFTLLSIEKITDREILARPYLVGDLVDEYSPDVDVLFRDYCRVRLEEINQFKKIDFTQRVSKKQFESLRDIPEATVKRTLAAAFDEFVVAKDWGGEECDLCTSNAVVGRKRLMAAFLLKGPARFHEMTLADCGKNADQVYRLFNIPADLFILQHCHKVSPAVVRTMQAFASDGFNHQRRYAIINGYETYLILRHFKIVS